MKWIRWRLELAVVAIVLIMLLGLTVPSFLTVQTMGKARGVQEYLSVLLNEIDLYHQQYGTSLLPASMTWEPDNIPYTIQFGFCSRSGMEKAAGLLRASGSAYELPDLFQKSETPLGERYQFFSIHQFGRQTSPETMNLALAAQWPYADKETQKAFDQSMTAFPSLMTIAQFFRTMTDGGAEQAMKDTPMASLFYHPSNGLESAGFIYIDKAGNRIP